VLLTETTTQGRARSLRGTACQTATSLTERGGANLEHRYALKCVQRQLKGLTRTAVTCRSFICAGHGTLQASWGSRGRRFKSCRPDGRPDGEIGRYPSLGMPPDSLPELQKLVTEVITC
jgi:hypothetical protein